MACVRQPAPNVVGARKLKALRFWVPFGSGTYGATYAVQAHWKAHSGLPISDMNFFHVLWLRRYRLATSEYRLEVAFFEVVGHFGLKFQVEGDVPHQPFVHG